MHRSDHLTVGPVAIRWLGDDTGFLYVSRVVDPG